MALANVTISAITFRLGVRDDSDLFWETLVKASWPLLALLAATFLLFPSVVVAYALGSHYPQDECSRLQYNKQLAQSKYQAL